MSICLERYSLPAEQRLPIGGRGVVPSSVTEEWGPARKSSYFLPVLGHFHPGSVARFPDPSLGNAEN